MVVHFWQRVSVNFPNFLKIWNLDVICHPAVKKKQTERSFLYRLNYLLNITNTIFREPTFPSLAKSIKFSLNCFFFPKVSSFPLWFQVVSFWDDPLSRPSRKNNSHTLVTKYLFLPCTSISLNHQEYFNFPTTSWIILCFFPVGKNGLH